MYAGTQAIQTRGRARRGTSGLPISRSQLPGPPRAVYLFAIRRSFESDKCSAEPGPRAIGQQSYISRWRRSFSLRRTSARRSTNLRPSVLRSTATSMTTRRRSVVSLRSACRRSESPRLPCDLLFSIVVDMSLLLSPCVELLKRMRCLVEQGHDLSRHLEPEIIEPVKNPRTDASRRETPDHASLLVEAAPDEPEDILHRDHVLFHACDLADLDHLAGAVPQPFQVHDHVDGARDLGPNCAHRQVVPRHQHEGLDPGQHVARLVGVNGGHRAGVAGVHRLQHVQRLRSTNLAPHDAVRPHAE